ncbi:MAG: thiamine pyrophosphate-binding protein [Rhizobiales bacterium]|nr:thiamine pyrophosphate-binding protein [Hyphomicrobiales bacterium]
MRRDHALEILKRHVGDDIVVAVYQALFDWMAIAPRPLNYISTGAMGAASSHALGLALARPDKRVLCFDGDGSLLMNLGSLVTIAGAAPENLRHFLFYNGTYEVNGAHPLPGPERIDFAAMALAAGYRRAWTLAALGELEENIAAILESPGPSLTVLAIEPGENYPRDYATIHSSAARERFRTAINQV